MDMPLRAGISGNTHRFMNQAGLLGVDPIGSRLAMLGHLIPTNAHSFHEVMSAAEPLAYVPGHYLPLAPLGEGDLNAAAVRAGVPDNMIAAVINKA